MDAPAVLGAVAGAERTAMASHYLALARQYVALAKVLDPNAKVSGGAGAAADGKRGRKRKNDTDADGEPRKKRENTAYTLYIHNTLPNFRKQVRSVGESRHSRVLGFRALGPNCAFRGHCPRPATPPGHPPTGCPTRRPVVAGGQAVGGATGRRGGAQ